MPNTDTTGPTKLRAKASEIEVLQWTGDNVSEMETFAGVMFHYDGDLGDDSASILTAQHSEWRTLYVGNYAVRNSVGGFEILDEGTLIVRYETVTPAGQQPWDYLKGGDEDCAEGACEDFYDEEGKSTGIEQCSHVTSAVANFGDVYIREHLESAVLELRDAMKRGTYDVPELLEQLDGAVYDIATGFDDDVNEIGRGGRKLDKSRLYAEVVADYRAEMEALAKSIPTGVKS
jgi:hypothetical protein